MEPQRIQEQLVIQERQAQLDLKEFLVPQRLLERQDILVIRDQLEKLDLRVFLELRQIQELLVRQVLRVLLDLRAPMVQRALRAPQGLAQQEQQVLQEQEV